MTEAEWLVSEDPARMLAWSRLSATGGRPISDRKLRLFACACARSHVWGSKPDTLPRVLAVAEAVADGAGRRELVEEWMAIGETTRAEEWLVGPTSECAAKWATLMLEDGQRRVAATLLRDVNGNPWKPVTLPKGPAKTCPRCEGDGWVCLDDGWGVRDRCKVCDGKGTLNLFGPCPWITPTVLSLAEAAYEERVEDGTLDPQRLLVLADALEEAGCAGEPCGECNGSGEIASLPGRFPATERAPLRWVNCPLCAGRGWWDSPILTHLRSPRPHVRGCHVLDAILNKS